MSALLSRKSFKKLIAVLLAVLIPATVCACRGEEDVPTQEAEPENTVELSVPYEPADGLNPFTITTETNSRLVSLMCRGLYYLDTAYTPQPDLAADSYLSGLSLEVVLGAEKFSDGRFITAADVVYSFERAKNSPLYSGRLSGIDGCTEKNSSSVVFSLSVKNVNITASLTFPIVENGTADEESSRPVSCGYYRYSAGHLSVNPHCESVLPAGRINLVDVTGEESQTALVDSGKLDFSFADMSGGESVQCASPSVSVYLNNLIYVGLNFNGPNMGSTSIRRAVALALDRRAIVETALQGAGRPASVPFNTSWSEFAALGAAGQGSDVTDRVTAVKLLSEFGIGERTGEGETDVKKLKLTLIYPETNSVMFGIARLISDQLALVNADVTLTAVPSAQYIQTINDGGYDMYIGEINLPDNMDASALLSPYGAAAAGISYSSLSCDEYYTDYLQGDITLSEFTDCFMSEQPFIPIAFRNGKFFFSQRVSGVGSVTKSALYRNLPEWKTEE